MKTCFFYFFLTAFLNTIQHFLAIYVILPIRTGVPQGSLLFIMYINDIVNVSRNVNLLLFADDTNIFLHDTDIVILWVRANKTLSDISDLFKLNEFSVNVKNVISNCSPLDT